MQLNSIKISFYFPRVSRKIKSKQELVRLIVKKMRSDGNIKCAGYLKEKDFLKDLSIHIGNGVSAYKNLSVRQQQAIEKHIRLAIKRSHRTLPHPDLPIFVFVYQWFPNSEDSVLFQGTMAFAAYYTLHLFVDIDSYTKNSLQQTIAHEWNHLVFYLYHPEQQYTLYTHMIMEGLAEIFREETMDGNISPWASALTKGEAMKQLKLFGTEFLNKKGMKIYRDVFFGNKKYKRWTGYSIGYWLVKEFRKENKNLSWEEIVKTTPEDILKSVVKK